MANAGGSVFECLLCVFFFSFFFLSFFVVNGVVEKFD